MLALCQSISIQELFLEDLRKICATSDFYKYYIYIDNITYKTNKFHHYINFYSFLEVSLCALNAPAATFNLDKKMALAQ